MVKKFILGLPLLLSLPFVVSYADNSCNDVQNPNAIVACNQIKQSLAQAKKQFKAQFPSKPSSGGSSFMQGNFDNSATTPPTSASSQNRSQQSTKNTDNTTEQNSTSGNNQPSSPVHIRYD